jgi:hypothetical protein
LHASKGKKKNENLKVNLSAFTVIGGSYLLLFTFDERMPWEW